MGKNQRGVGSQAEERLLQAGTWEWGDRRWVSRQGAAPSPGATDHPAVLGQHRAAVGIFNLMGGTRPARINPPHDLTCYCQLNGVNRRWKGRSLEEPTRPSSPRAHRGQAPSTQPRGWCTRECVGVTPQGAQPEPRGDQRQSGNGLRRGAFPRGLCGASLVQDILGRSRHPCASPFLQEPGPPICSLPAPEGGPRAGSRLLRGMREQWGRRGCWPAAHMPPQGWAPVVPGTYQGNRPPPAPQNRGCARGDAAQRFPIPPPVEPGLSGCGRNKLSSESEANPGRGRAPLPCSPPHQKIQRRLILKLVL